MLAHQNVLDLYRVEQIERLHGTAVDGMPLLIHGSLARAALMGETVPGLLMPNGQIRDVDVFTPGGLGKVAVEELLDEVGLANPSPIDAGLCEILVRDGDEAFAKKGDFIRPLRDFEVLDETRDYELHGTDGLAVRSFSSTGMLATHLLQQPLYRPDHYLKDKRFIQWLRDNETELPRGLEESIAEFHRAYNEAYPHGKLLTAMSEVYRAVVPEIIRSKFRQRTHKFMLTHAGRRTPFVS
jgi:hypothetical protein